MLSTGIINASEYDDTFTSSNDTFIDSSKPLMMHSFPIYSILKDPASDSKHVIGSVYIFELDDFEQWIIKDTLAPVFIDEKQRNGLSNTNQISNQFGHSISMSFNTSTAYNLNNISHLSGNNYRF